MSVTVRVDNSGSEMFRAILVKSLDMAVAAGAGAMRAAAVASFGKSHGGVPSAPGSPPNSQTGWLRRSVSTARVSQARYRVGTSVAYGKHLEFGASPHAKGKKLTIPLNAEAAMLRRRTPDLRSLNLSIMPTRKRGEWLLGRKSGKGKTARFVALFLLVDSVTIAARPWLGPTFRSERNRQKAGRTMQMVLTRQITDAMRSAVSGSLAVQAAAAFPTGFGSGNSGGALK